MLGALSLAFAALVPATTASATDHAVVTSISGNATCKELLDNPTAYEIKVEPTSAIANGATFGPITFTGVNAAKTLLGFTSTAPIDAVFVKGGPVGGALYSYDPPTTADSNMGVVDYGDGRYAISHVSFCWNEEPPTYDALTATKTATATYDRDITWQLAKSASPTTLSGVAGGSAGSTSWIVTATKTAVESAFSVTGEIVVSNPNSIPVSFSVSDSLDDGTGASVSCPSTTVAASSSVTCTYSAAPSSRTATVNNAVITSLTTGVGGTTAQAPLTWNGTVTGDESRTLTDDRFPLFEQTIADEGETTVTLPEPFTCSDDPTQYTGGFLRTVEDNVATLAGAGGSLTANASVTIDCTLAALTAAKTAAGAYDRYVTWELTKTVDDDAHSGLAGQSAGTSLWTITATKTVENLGHVVTGAITVGNPAAIDQTFTVDDVLDNGAVGVVSCPSYTVPAGGEVVCTYTADGPEATLNTATVTAAGNDPVVATATVSYTPNTIGDDEVLLTDPRLGLSETISDTTTRDISEDFTCSSNASDYVRGVNNRLETNTALLTGDGVALTASEDVGVSCTLPPLEVSKTAAASYQNDIDWSLAKTVDDPSHSGPAGQTAGSSTWTVTVTRTDTPRDYRVEGTITITNPSSIDIPLLGVDDRLSDGTVAAVDCPATVVPANGSIECTYVATPSNATAWRNHVAVKSVGNTVQTARADVSFTRYDHGAQTVTLGDVRFDGLVTDTSVSTTVNYAETFSCPSDPNVYTDGHNSRTETNVATLVGEGVDLTASATVDVDCTLAALEASKTANGSYDRFITWDVVKTVSPDSHSGLAGLLAGSSTWSVEVTKNVVETNHLVTGVILVTNPGSIAQTFSVSDVLDDGTPADVVCATYTLAPGQSATCSYAAGTPSATSNTATVTAPGNGPVLATAGVAYTGTTYGPESVTLTDDRYGMFPQEIGESATYTYDEDFSCSGDAADYVDGADSYTVVNTARIVGGDVDTSSSASVTVDCTLPPLTATKTAAAGYDNTITWTLAKTVDPSSHSGYFGQLAGSSTWTVTADRTDVESNFAVTGEIVVTNPSAIAVPFVVTDVLDDTTGATVTCPATTVPAGGSVTCSYTAAPGGRTATLNTATVTGTGNPAFTATAPVSFVRNDIGDASVTLADPRFGVSQTISEDTVVPIDEAFYCSGNIADYTNGSYSRTETNSATLTGASTDLSASAQVTIDCRGYDETATGAGTRWPKTDNWFMYTPFTTSKVDLIAGQKYDAGDITMVKVSKQWTDITITLHNGFVMAPVQNNVKIHDMAKAPTTYVQPGAFNNKFTVTGQTFTLRVPTANFYGIHLDVIRLS